MFWKIQNKVYPEVYLIFYNRKKTVQRTVFHQDNVSAYLLAFNASSARQRVDFFLATVFFL